MRIGYDVISTNFIIDQDHPNGTCKSSLLAYLRSSIIIIFSKADQNLSFHLLGIKGSSLTSLTASIEATSISTNAFILMINFPLFDFDGYKHALTLL